MQGVKPQKHEWVLGALIDLLRYTEKNGLSESATKLEETIAGLSLVLASYEKPPVFAQPEEVQVPEL